LETKRKNSKKRTAILEQLSSATDHPTAEMLYNRLKPKYPQLSLGTVYRNLSVLAEEGLVLNVAHVAGQERYDLCTKPHAHFICRGCRRVMDLNIPDTLSSVYMEIEKQLGCVADSHCLNFTGLCNNCSQP